MNHLKLKKYFFGGVHILSGTELIGGHIDLLLLTTLLLLPNVVYERSERESKKKKKKTIYCCYYKPHLTNVCMCIYEVLPKCLENLSHEIA